MNLSTTLGFNLKLETLFEGGSSGPNSERVSAFNSTSFCPLGKAGILENEDSGKLASWYGFDAVNTHNTEAWQGRTILPASKVTCKIVFLASFFNIEELYCGGSLAISLIDSGTTYRALAEIQGEQTKTSTDKKVGATSKLTTPDLQNLANFLCVLIVWVYSYEVINYRRFTEASAL